MPSLQIPKKLKSLLTKPKRFKVAIGGRGSGKSQGFASAFIMKAQTEQAMVLCCREYQNSLEDSVYGLITSEVERLEVDGYNFQAAKIDCDGGGFRFRGLARNPHSIKSLHGFKYCWVEEAQTISQESLELLTPSIREQDSEIWFSANPQSQADPFSQRFIVPYREQLERDGYYEDDLHIIVKINWRDNPWFPEELEQERLHDYETKPRALYDHIWEGAFNDSIDNALIKAEWFDAAIDAHKKLGFEPTGQEVVAHDPSDLGPDPKGLCHRYGSVILNVMEKENGDIAEGFDWALGYAIQNQVDCFIWDGDGMGVGGRRQVSEALAGKKIEPVMFRGSETPDQPSAAYMPADSGKKDIKTRTNKDTFYNQRAQRYWQLRDRFYKTYLAVTNGKYINPDELISLSSEIERMEQLRSELCRIPVKPGAKIQILNKQEMKKKPYQLPSPNLADSVMMSEAMPNAVEQFAEIEFDSLW